MRQPRNSATDRCCHLVSRIANRAFYLSAEAGGWRTTFLRFSPKGPKPHPAMTVPGRLTLDDRPAGAKRRSRFGHYEMDTVVSSTNGTGGLLVLVDRKSRRYVIEKLEHVTQDEVVAALRRMIARKALGKVRSITTDNGCEFLDPGKIKAVVRMQRLLHPRLRLLGKGLRRELRPLRPQVVSEGNRLRQMLDGGHAPPRARSQLNPPQAPRREDRI